MAFPTVDAVNGNNSAGTTTNHVCALPSGINVSGKRILVFLTTRANGENPTFPSGWSVVSQGQIDTTFGVGTLVQHVTDGTEGYTGDGSDTITATTTSACGSANTSFLISGSAAVEAGGASSNRTGAPDSGSFSPSWGGADTLWIAAALIGAGQSATFGYPASYTNDRLDRWNNSSGAMVMTARRTLAASSEDPGAFSLSTSRSWRAITVALQPTGGGGSGFQPAWAGRSNILLQTGRAA